MDCSLRHRFRPRRLDADSAHMAAQPATYSVAVLVLLMDLYRMGRGPDDKTSRSGPVMSILPKLEKMDGFKLASNEATDLTVGKLAGASGPGVVTGGGGSKRCPLYKTHFRTYLFILQTSARISLPKARSRLRAGKPAARSR